jgi:hypothetical protein
MGTAQDSALSIVLKALSFAQLPIFSVSLYGHGHVVHLFGLVKLTYLTV